MKKYFRKFRTLWDYIYFFATVRGSGHIFLVKHYRKLWPAMKKLATVYRRKFLRKTRVVAIVGSVGKTTTTQTIRHCIHDRPPRQSWGNFKSSLAENILRARPGHKHLVLEVGIGQPGHMAEFTDMVSPDIVVVTAVKSDHHVSFKTLEKTREEKSLMVAALKPEGIAVLNGDDENVRWMAGQTQAKIIFIGYGENNHIRATDVKEDFPHGTRFTLHLDGESREARVPLLGRHMVYPALAAIAVCREEGMDLDQIIRKLSSVKAPTSRMEVIRLSNGAMLIDDSYKGSYESFVEAFETLKNIPARRRIIVMGKITFPPGKQGPFIREMGLRASRSCDLVVFCGDSFQRFRSGAVIDGDMDYSQVNYTSSRIPKTIDWLKENLRDGDVCLLKSSSSRRIERIALALQGKDVKCAVRECKIEVVYCRLCPLLNRDEKIFNNAFVRSDVKV